MELMNTNRTNRSEGDRNGIYSGDDKGRRGQVLPDLSTSAGKFSAAFVKWFGKTPAALQVLNNFLGEVAPVRSGHCAR